mgnify:CR=1 FL=1
MAQYRQGDVFLEQVEVLPDGAVDVAPENGRLVLAHGEATGHAHTLAMSDGAYYAKGAERFLRIVREEAFLRHEEHAPIGVPPGLYRVRRQREYTPEEIRTVLD